jgi:hypothetical protein
MNSPPTSAADRLREAASFNIPNPRAYRKRRLKAGTLVNARKRNACFSSAEHWISPVSSMDQILS